MEEYERVLREFNRVLNGEDYQHRLNLLYTFVADITNLVRTPSVMFEQLLAAVERDYKRAPRNAENTARIAEKLDLPEVFVSFIEQLGDEKFLANVAVLRAWIEARSELKKTFQKHVKDEGFFID